MQYEYLNALRGIAILAVISVHCAQVVVPVNEYVALIMRQGSNGVQLFFIISAVTLGLTWERAKNTNSNNILFTYLLRRFFRIAPMFYLAMAYQLWFYGLSPRYWAPDGISLFVIPFTILFAHGFHPETINAIVPGGWSIAAEVIFYSVFPCLIACSDNIKIMLLLLAMSILLYVVNKVGLGLWLAALYPSSELYIVTAFTSMNFFGVFPVFLIGIIVYMLIFKFNTKSQMALVALIGFSVATLVVFAINNSLLVKLLLHPLTWSLWWGLFVIIVAHWRPKIIDNSVLDWLGRISYSMYIVHFIVLDLFIRKYEPSRWEVSGGVFFIAITVVTSFISNVTYRFIELPCIKLGGVVINSINRASAH